MMRASDPNAVNAFISNLEHPHSDVVATLRQVILQASPSVGEEIKWNAPSFFYTGAMQTFNPKEYKRHLVVFNLHKQDCIQLVFLSGAKVRDASGLLTGDYKDGRRLAQFYDVSDVGAKKPALQHIILEQVQLLEAEQLALKDRL
jgi:hypothetical protein